MYPNILLSTPPPSTSFWQDPAGWVGVGVTILVGIATILITIWTVYVQRNQKRIMYQVISDAPIASINKVVKDRVKILFDGNPVEDMDLLVLKVWNPGRIAVRRDDFDEPITFEFEGRKVVGSDVLSTDPDQLINPNDAKTFLTISTESVRLQKLLLNPKETINLKVLLTGSQGKINVRARIVDGKITEFDPNSQQSNRFPLQVIAGLSAIALVATGDSLLILNSTIIGLMLLILGIALIAAVFIPVIKKSTQYYV